MRLSPLVALGSFVGLLGCTGADTGAAGVPLPGEPAPAPTAPQQPTAAPTMPPPPPEVPPDAGGAGRGHACEAPGSPAAPAALLTRVQYDNTLADLLGDASRPASVFPPENQVDGFNNNVAAHRVNPLLVEKYLEAAEGVAARAVAGSLERIAPCDADADARECGRAFVRNFGERAFRRPLTAPELQIFDDLFERSYLASGFSFGVELVLTAILQSPQFLYRVDALTEAPTVETGAVALAPYELASRLSYFLVGSMPDDELFTAASKSQLVSDDQIAAQARRLLATPRAREMVREFHHQWLKLDALPSLTRLASDLGSMPVTVGADYVASLDRFIDHVYWDVGNLSALLTSKTVFISPALAPLLGVNAASAEWAAVELPDRAGILTQPGLLALLAHADQSAPVLRGVFVRQRLLCLDVPPPPPAANTTPPDPDPNATTRERFRQHTASPECSGCHRLFDGLGFGLEGYDQLGRYRTTENGLPLDTSGEVYGTGVEGLDGNFAGAAELSARLAGSQAVRDCMATTWYRYAVGRQLTESDACSLEQTRAAFADAAGDLRELMVAITLSDGFRYRAPNAREMQGSP